MANLPLQNVPGVAPESAPANDYQRIDSGPADFGGLIGGAEQKFGAQTQQGAGDLAQVAIQRQDRYNQIANDNALNQLQAGADSIAYGTPGDPSNPGLLNLKGADALAAGPGAMQALEQLRQTIRGNLNNDAQRLEFDASARNILRWKESEIGRHLDAQQTEWGIASSQAGLSQQAYSAAQNFSDPQHLDNLAEDGAKFSVKLLQGHLGDAALQNSDLVNKAIRDGRTAVYQSAILSAATQNPTVAGQILQRVRPKLDPAVADELDRHLQSAGDAATANSIVNLAMGLPPGPGAAANLTPEIRARAQAVHDAVVRQGGSDDEGWGWAANAVHESGAQTAPTPGDGGISHGMFQLNKGQLAAYRAAHNGQMPEQGSIDEQVAFARHQAGDLSGIKGGPEGFASAISDTFEVPAGGAGEAANRAQTARLLAGGAPPPTTPDGTLANGVTLASVQQSVPKVPQGNVGNIPDYDTAMANVLAATAGNYKQQQLAIAELNRRYAAQKKAAADAQEAAARPLITQIIKDPTKVDPVRDIAQNPAFNSVEVEHYMEFYRKAVADQAAGTGAHDDKTYGKSFWNLNDAVLSGKISDPHVLSAIAAAQPDQLTVAGYDKLNAAMQSRKTPEGAAEAEQQSLFWKWITPQIKGGAKDAYGMDMPDPKGDEIMLKVAPAYYAAVAKGKAQGLSIGEMLNPEDPHFIGTALVKTYARTQAQRMADMNAAYAAANPVPPSADANGASVPDLTSKDNVMKALSAHAITWDQAADALSGLGFKHAAPPAPAAPGPSLVPTGQ